MEKKPSPKPDKPKKDKVKPVKRSDRFTWNDLSEVTITKAAPEIADDSE